MVVLPPIVAVTIRKVLASGATLEKVAQELNSLDCPPLKRGPWQDWIVRKVAIRYRIGTVRQLAD